MDMYRDDDSGHESDGVKPRVVYEDFPPPPRKSAQQAKYDLEKPTVKPRPVVVKKAPSKPKIKAEPQDATVPAAVADEAEWGPTAQLVYPRKGDLRLTDQNEEVQGVVKDAIELALVDLAFTSGYPNTGPSRGIFVRPYLLQSARDRGATDIKRRVRKDISFSQALADLICARIGILRNTIKKITLAKVPVYYQLTSEGVRSSDVRERVAEALHNQRYIFPITWRPVKQPELPADTPPDAAPTDVPGATPTNVPTGPSAAPKRVKLEMKFKVNLPFHASPIVDIMQEVFFSGNKSLGHKHKQLFTSPNKDLPKELELPDVMLALVAANVAGALHTWKSGRFQGAEFSQERLEMTYIDLLKTISGTREDTPDKFHKVMHDLYLKTTQSAASVAVATLGSARNVIRLDLADDSE
ncbi:hypothetical protein B0H11DRAFT_80824 [Mycena galericulata]|nr:hypothetical protein B0H11DRAFT_80824 [Mycena galericulata]